MRRRIRRGWNSAVERSLLAWEGITLVLGDAWIKSGALRSGLAAQAARTRLSPLLWSFFYVALFCLVAMAAIDQPVARFFKAHVHGDIEGFFKVVTRLGEAQLYLIPAGLLWIGMMVVSLRAASRQVRQRWRRLSFTPAFLFVAIALSGLISNAIKISLGRYRPRYLFEQELYGFSPFNTQWGMNSFPSGHSQAAFAAMTALMIIFPRYAGAWLVIAVLVAASRVVTTVHYLSDAVAGAWLAVCVTVLLARALRARGIDPRIG